MYQHNSRQIEAFKTPFRTSLNTENRWVRLLKLIPWDKVVDVYVSQPERKRKGQRACTSRFAFGVLVTQERLGFTDRGTVENIQENPYLQWFIGLQKFQIKPPLDHSQVCRFKKRFSAEAIAENNNEIIRAFRRKNTDIDIHDGDAEGGSSDIGQLLADATAHPSDITFPTDLKLLNKSRELLESMVDLLHSELEPGFRNPWTYLQRVRKVFLSVQKKKQPGGSRLRKARQPGYVRRDLAHVDSLLEEVGFKALPMDLYRCNACVLYFLVNDTQSCLSLTECPQTLLQVLCSVSVSTTPILVCFSWLKPMRFRFSSRL